MSTDKYEVIFAIVNSGLSDDVMELAREQGVRGGTIINGRGVTNEEAAAFFGITLHAEKEILMMVVEKSIKNNVLNAIYKGLDMAKKSKGIAFSLPVSDVAGLVQHIKEDDTKQ
ncbi:MAG: P-II family nitrogen regulator [Ruminococcaceae bacterium]|nr:P-II family nitrogen regulator [Oscillospiraceae bacterium]